MITLDAVRKQYRSSTDTVDIGPLDLEIPAGGVTALVGPNGAGKSTLLTMVGRLNGIDEGAIEVACYDVSSTSSKDLAKILSVLRQENHFITRLTVRQLVASAASLTKGATALDEQKISEAIDFWTSSISRTAISTSSPAGSASVPMSRWSSPRTPSTCCWTSP